MFTTPLPSGSNAGQREIGCSPSEMFTPRTSSSIVTRPLPSQSPTQVMGVLVGVNTASVVVAVAVDVTLTGGVAVGVSTEVVVAVAVDVTLTGGVAVGVSAEVVVAVAADVTLAVGVTVGVRDWESVALAVVVEVAAAVKVGDGVAVTPAMRSAFNPRRPTLTLGALACSLR